MVCSICHGTTKDGERHPGNARTCPDLKVGVGDMAEAIVSGAVQVECVAALTAVCAPAGIAAGLALSANALYTAGKKMVKLVGAKTDVEKRSLVKRAILDFVAEKGSS